MPQESHGDRELAQEAGRQDVRVRWQGASGPANLGRRSSVSIEATYLTARPPALFSQENTKKGTRMSTQGHPQAYLQLLCL